MLLAPGFRSPDPTKFDYEAYNKYIEEKLPLESPMMFGLHSNAEINYLTATGDRLFNAIVDVQGGAGGGEVSRKTEDLVAEIIQDLLEKTPENFNFLEVSSRAKEKTPSVIVCLQEVERMNILLSEIRRSLVEL